MALNIEPDPPEPVRVCGNCGVTDVGRPHTFIQCIHNLRDLLRRYREHVIKCESVDFLGEGMSQEILKEDEAKFILSIGPEFTYQSKRTRKNELATGQSPTGNEESGGD